MSTSQITVKQIIGFLIIAAIIIFIILLLLSYFVNEKEKDEKTLKNTEETLKNTEETLKNTEETSSTTLIPPYTSTEAINEPVNPINFPTPYKIEKGSKDITEGQPSSENTSGIKVILTESNDPETYKLVEKSHLDTQGDTFNKNGITSDQSEIFGDDLVDFPTYNSAPLSRSKQNPLDNTNQTFFQNITSGSERYTVLVDDEEKYHDLREYKGTTTDKPSEEDTVAFVEAKVQETLPLEAETVKISEKAEKIVETALKESLIQLSEKAEKEAVAEGAKVVLSALVLNSAELELEESIKAAKVVLEEAEKAEPGRNTSAVNLAEAAFNKVLEKQKAVEAAKKAFKEAAKIEEEKVQATNKIL